jgi:hypothetical protein
VQISELSKVPPEVDPFDVLNDGKATIDGQSASHSLRFRRNDYFVLEGFDAHHSKGNVVSTAR